MLSRVTGLRSWTFQNALIHDAFMASYVYEVIKDVEWCLGNKNSTIEAPFIDLRRAVVSGFDSSNVVETVSVFSCSSSAASPNASSAFFLNLSSSANASMIWFFKDSRLFRSLSAASFTGVGANVGASS
ncbi:hypothetical protein L1987_20229 [Smallanthus sonchifolius]|uniref:Uncharacterized protein n=1 Tax=Smallanthus sonchifolius TaxID=185202 RepID=A0ACB9IQU3_9ASTR|nr:hypothetical protein L1987_20229 [Smallanthus sonchifolius]